MIKYQAAEDRKINIEIQLLKNKPHSIHCGHRQLWDTRDSVITYDEVTPSSQSGGVGGIGGLDRTTGVFTAGHSGIWSITYSVQSFNPEGYGYNTLYIWINQVKFTESQHYVDYYKSKTKVYSLGGRTFYRHLSAGNTVTLRAGHIYTLNWITLCLEVLPDP